MNRSWDIVLGVTEKNATFLLCLSFLQFFVHCLFDCSSQTTELNSKFRFRFKSSCAIFLPKKSNVSCFERLLTLLYLQVNNVNDDNDDNGDSVCLKVCGIGIPEDEFRLFSSILPLVICFFNKLSSVINSVGNHLKRFDLKAKKKK